MINIIRQFFEKLSDNSKIVAFWSVLYGWFCGLFLLDVSTLWEYVLKGFGSVAFGGISLFCGLAVKDLYKYAKPKTLKFVSGIIKNKKNGKEKEAA